MAEPFLGEITLFAGNFAPRGWMFCDGQLLPINQYSALFAILGTTYGGDGETDFALPDLRGRVPVGENPQIGGNSQLSNRSLGSRGGVESVQLTTQQMPSHDHTVTPTLGAQSGDADAHEPGPGRTLATPTVQGNTGLNVFSDQPADTDIEGARVVDVTDTGDGQAHNNMQPFLALNYIIAVFGVFPSEN